MPQYEIKADGKLHTRYTDLMRATPKQVENIIKEQTGEKKRFSNNVLTFGETRHAMWEKEAKQTGMLPIVFVTHFLNTRICKSPTPKKSSPPNCSRT